MGLAGFLHSLRAGDGLLHLKEIRLSHTISDYYHYEVVLMGITTGLLRECQALELSGMPEEMMAQLRPMIVEGKLRMMSTLMVGKKPFDLFLQALHDAPWDRCPRLEVMRPSFVLSYHQLHALAKVLSTGKYEGITTMEVRYCGRVNDDALHAFFSSLSFTPNLRSLELRGGMGSTNSALCLAEQLRGLAGLKRLSLYPDSWASEGFGQVYRNLEDRADPRSMAVKCLTLGEGGLTKSTMQSFLYAINAGSLSNLKELVMDADKTLDNSHSLNLIYLLAGRCPGLWALDFGRIPLGQLEEPTLLNLIIGRRAWPQLYKVRFGNTVIVVEENRIMRGGEVIHQTL